MVLDTVSKNSITLFLKKLLEDVVHQNKSIDQKSGRQGLQKIGGPT